MEKINTILSLFALGFSLFTYWLHERKIKNQEEKVNQYELEKFESEKIEIKKAIVEANVISGPNGKRTIKVYNKGKATAKDVIVTIPEDEKLTITSNPFPIDIKPQHGFDINLFLSIGFDEKIVIKFEWKDDFQEKNYETQMLQL